MTSRSQAASIATTWVATTTFASRESLAAIALRASSWRWNLRGALHLLAYRCLNVGFSNMFGVVNHVHDPQSISHQDYVSVINRRKVGGQAPRPERAPILIACSSCQPFLCRKAVAFFHRPPARRAFPHGQRPGSQSPWSRDRAEMCPVSKMSLAQTHTVRGMTSRACVFCTHIPTTYSVLAAKAHAGFAS